MTILTRRFVLTGLIAAPAVIAYDRLMPIKSYGDWVRIRDFSYPNKTLEFYLDMKNCLEKVVYEIFIPAHITKSRNWVDPYYDKWYN